MNATPEEPITRVSAALAQTHHQLLKEELTFTMAPSSLLLLT
jgi:hypothetical protein